MRTLERPQPTLRRPILSEDVVSFTECRGKLGEYFEKTRRTHRPIIVTQNGRPTSVIISITDWESVMPDFEEMPNEATRATLNGILDGSEPLIGPFDNATDMLNNILNG